MTEADYKELDANLAKMVKALAKKGDNYYALGYLESFLSGIIAQYVTDPVAFERVQKRMLNITIDTMQ
jgi:hypothetical protein